MLNEKAAAARRAYRRKWAKEHPDKVREHQERYWTRKAEQAEREAQQNTAPIDPEPQAAAE